MRFFLLLIKKRESHGRSLCFNSVCVACRDYQRCSADDARCLGWRHAPMRGGRRGGGWREGSRGALGECSGSARGASSRARRSMAPSKKRGKLQKECKSRTRGKIKKAHTGLAVAQPHSTCAPAILHARVRFRFGQYAQQARVLAHRYDPGLNRTRFCTWHTTKPCAFF